LRMGFLLGSVIVRNLFIYKIFADDPWLQESCTG
jgi:hypothetical protein